MEEPNYSGFKCFKCGENYPDCICEEEMEVNKIYQGDALQVLKTFPDNMIDCVMTSPPYWALRNYGIEGQIGLEPTFSDYINKICNIFDEVKRVLKETGTCWVNLGDTYSGGGSGQKDTGKHNYPSEIMCGTGNKPSSNTELEDKSLCNIPARFSIEMQNRGWILRNVIIWHKPNCMPSSVRDRFTVDFEYLFFFTKNKRYFFETQFEPHKLDSIKRACRGRQSSKFDKGEYSTSYKTEYQGYDNMMEKLENGELRGVGAFGRNKRTVWTISTKGFPESHFAIYPEELCKTPIKSGCPEYICNKCGKAREMMFDYKYVGKTKSSYDDGYGQSDIDIPHIRELPKKLGYSDCGCNAGFSSGIVLDPFAGAGTTLLVALKQNKKFVGIEINPEYIKIIDKRLKPYLTQTKLNGDGGTNFTKSSADDFPYQESLINVKREIPAEISPKIPSGNPIV